MPSPIHLLFAFVFASLQGFSQKPLSVIAFGSCDHQDVLPKMWDHVLQHRPDLWIWGGDIVYGDTEDMDSLRAKYDRQYSQPGYQRLLQQAAVTGIYDDHDYGLNDGGKEYSRRKESRDILFDFLQLTKDDPARFHEGAYHSRTYGPSGKQVKVIHLDTRYFRDSLRKQAYDDPIYPGVLKRNIPTPGLDILGEAQWEWLEKELTASEASIHIINSSIQVLSSEHPFEKWANFPDARERLFQLIHRTKARGVIIISGDRHIAELSRMEVPAMASPLYDFTSSGLTHTWSKTRPEPNKYRVGDLIVQKNFGIIRIEWKASGPELRLEVRGEGNQIFADHTIHLPQ